MRFQHGNIFIGVNFSFFFNQFTALRIKATY